MKRQNEEHIKVAVLPADTQFLSHQFCLEVLVPMLEKQIACAGRALLFTIGTTLAVTSLGAATKPLLPASTKQREFTWSAIEAEEARLAMIFAGHRGWVPTSTEYVIPDDSISHFTDCAYWVVVGELRATPVLPVRPVITVPHASGPHTVCH